MLNVDNKLPDLISFFKARDDIVAVWIVGEADFEEVVLGLYQDHEYFYRKFYEELKERNHHESQYR
ncbi:hypothetical protein B0S90_2613 [Caldicellulosiruptor bescii]|uniref:DNA polymerase beta subunit n=2 Tax=Caldicellulosiruptor bescii TaxID=31899 RepID=B9MMP9_CALBD|nr:hypothetical protein [Caldicellulosiruptor bescii]ACM61348.1 DNA polymerase beta subunit [Caldicellulosiruptor bescii DSM 6725]PBC88838.1 hypothetical protein B0S87_1878 [Caldicellulosiruptor bescii]PBC91680.1 hypothetical protein B0S89_2114 [Caldicellulosiruptor bescii]PBD02907.1 hypothetical protein B0S85_0458 [Caldicellulosiruptor bescii]PBD07476.1 hypothetical protein B0S90_2613 [Caldicellulosiruptor bescii]